MTLREVGDVCHVSLSTVRRLVDRGDLKTVRIGERGVRVAADDLARYLKTARLEAFLGGAGLDESARDTIALASGLADDDFDDKTETAVRFLGLDQE